MNMKITIFCLLIVLAFTNKFGNLQKVAIIGKKLGGGLCSHFLHETIPGIKIDVYNHQPKKETTFTGVAFNSHDLYLNDLVKKKQVESIKGQAPTTTKEGDKYYSSSIKELTGYETFHEALNKYFTQQLEIYKQIYDFQKNERTFKTVRELLKSLSLDFEDYFTNETTESLLINKNPLISANSSIQKYIKSELANNFLDTNTHGFVGLAFLMFSEIIEEIQQIDTADYGSFINSLFHSNDEIIEMDVSKIIRKNNQNYVIPKGGKRIPYDFIILATTSVADLIHFEGFTDPVKIFKYRDVHCVYLTGRLTKKFIKFSKDLIPIVDIQTNWVYMQIPYLNRMVYSISGLQEPSESDILQYVKKPFKIKIRFTIHGSPDYSIKDDESLQNAKFELAENVYNAHALHSLSTDNELLAIGAKNIALLIKTRIEEIGAFTDIQNPSCDTAISNSSSGQRINETFDEESTINDRTRVSNGVGQITIQRFDEQSTRGTRSTVKKRTKSRTGKSRDNRKSKHSGSKN